jgi:hypothetical protein
VAPENCQPVGAGSLVKDLQNKIVGIVGEKVPAKARLLLKLFPAAIGL